MAQIILVTGGSRSGKSSFAEKKARELSDSRLYVATCPVTDPEMEKRIERHRRERSGMGWLTEECELKLGALLESHHDVQVVLVDCLTLWINNLMYRAEQVGERVSEEKIEKEIISLGAVCRQRPGTVIFVTNEVGLGIVPENKQARLYRDLVGRCNQCMAGEADEVYLVTCAIPQQLKGESNAVKGKK